MLIRDSAFKLYSAIQVRTCLFLNLSLLHLQAAPERPKEEKKEKKDEKEKKEEKDKKEKEEKKEEKDGESTSKEGDVEAPAASAEEEKADEKREASVEMVEEKEKVILFMKVWFKLFLAASFTF